MQPEAHWQAALASASGTPSQTRITGIMTIMIMSLAAEWLSESEPESESESESGTARGTGRTQAGSGCQWHLRLRLRPGLKLRLPVHWQRRFTPRRVTAVALACQCQWHTLLPVARNPTDTARASGSHGTRRLRRRNLKFESS